MKDENGNKIWFYAKTYGYGWGMPASWEGWLTMILYLLVMAGGCFVVPMGYYGLVALAATAVLLIILFKRGEKLQWRFGSKQCSPRQKLLFSILLHILLGPLLLALAIWFYCCPPKNINGGVGYRTPVSMSSQVMWDEAQIYSAEIFLVGICITVAYQFVSAICMKPEISLISSFFIMLFAVAIVIPLTELHLHKFQQKISSPAQINATGM